MHESNEPNKLLLGFSVKKTPDGNVRYKELIDISHVPELTEVKVTNEGVTLGGALSLSKMMNILEELIAEGPGNAYLLCPNRWKWF